ncbi:sugar transferase [Paenibacillus sp. FSL A5-0031]|uniref:sugar transferase n=1 Tax=Paenibacillus sp. FSL A5-0031 TaxID=1920420 RepID=UPI00096FD9D7|nr:sugar transferase [Paenibacillus sp. FSL A5-0031]OME83955.1 sugar transferase [Paenibacillus sp. FSL A5-0031]
MPKRLFDFIISCLLLIALSPIIAITAVLVRFKLGSPILFKQQRPGLHGVPFLVYKFRTMTSEKDSLGQLLPDHLRLTAFGVFMRKFSLDELLQLINVIKGDLSLIGPRPLLMEYLPLYNEKQAKRHLVRPGITGWAQIHGRNAVSWEERFEYDVWYVENQSFKLDLKILLLTVKKVIKSEGVSNGNYVTMPVFQGTTTNSEG